MPLTASPALRWLSAACRQDGRDLAPPPFEWEVVLPLARRHRVESLLQAGLTTRGIELPPAIADRLRIEAQATTVANLRAVVECRRLQDGFDQAGVPLLFVKGLTLSQLAYGNAALKMSRDVDLLVPPDQILEAASVLTGMGYRLQQPRKPARLARWHRWSKESVWAHPSGLLVELHGRLTDHPRLLPSFTARSPGQQVTVAAGIDLPTLRSDALLAYLALHGASSAWFRLKWLADFVALLERVGLDPAEALRAMQSMGAGRAAGTALLLAAAVCDVALGDALAVTLERDRATRWLAGEALRQLETMTEPTERRGGTIGIHASQLLLGDTWSFPLSEAGRRIGELAVRRLSEG